MSGNDEVNDEEALEHVEGKWIALWDMCIVKYIVDVAIEQERVWEETMDDTPATEDDARNGGVEPVQVNTKLLLDIEVLVSRLVAKASQLIGNFTTNLAENWMSIRCKLEGGKVINRSQSGSWAFRVWVLASEKT